METPPLLLHQQLRTAIARSAVLILALAAAACSSGGVNTTPVSTTPPTGLATSPATTPTTSPTSGPTTAPTTTPTSAPTTAPTAAPTGAAPLACTGQTTTATNASVTQTLATTGGALCIPAFGGFGGTLNYPTVTSSVNVTLTSSTTNDAGFPALGTTTPVFFLQIALAGGTTFGTGAAAGGGLASTSIVVGQTYTVFGQATIAGIPINFSPCQSVATAGSGGTGVISGLATVLKNAAIPLAATGVLEIEHVSAGAGPC
jgi:hypothetical protein